MKRTRRARRGALVGLATAVIVTIALASVLTLTRLPVYRSTSTAAHPPVAAGTHVLVQQGRAARAGDLVVFRDPERTEPQIGRLGPDTAAASEVVGVVIRQGSLLSLVAYLLALAALVGVPLGVLVGLVVALGLPRRRRRTSPEAHVLGTAPGPDPGADDWDAAFEDEGLDLVLTGEASPRSS